MIVLIFASSVLYKIFNEILKHFTAMPNPSHQYSYALVTDAEQMANVFQDQFGSVFIYPNFPNIQPPAFESSVITKTLTSEYFSYN